MAADPVDELHTTPPAEFIAVRNRIAGELKKAGDAKRAAEVKAMKKPSPSVWATNQVARRDPQAVRRFLKTSDELRRAQTGRGAGGDSLRAYQAALAAQREELPALLKVARAALDEAGGAKQPVLEKVAANFRNGAAVADLRPLLLEGTLTEDVAAQGFEAAFGGAVVVSAPPRRTPPSTRPPAGERRTVTDKRAAAAQAREAAAAEREAAAAAKKAAAEARRHADAAARAAETAEKKRRAAEETVARLRAELETAEAELRDARRTHDEAARAADEARRHSDSLSRGSGRVSG